MTACSYCLALENKSHLVFEDDLVAAMLVKKPAVAGHLVVLPKKHASLIEQVPDFVMTQLFIVANKLSIALFDSLKAEGSNVLIQNGPGAGQTSAHVLLQVIPRRQGDGLDLSWNPQQVPDEEMSSAESAVKRETSSIGSFEVPKADPKEIPEAKVIDESEEYLMRSLERLP